MENQDAWNENAILVDLLFQTNLPVSQIAQELGWTQAETVQRIKELGLTWVRRNDRKLSRGHAALTNIMRKLLPGVDVINEHHIGERLMLDVFCPKYQLAAEYHGRQHFYYSSLFHKDHDDFIAGQKRDERKVELCKENGISLIVFRYNDVLTEDLVYNRMLQAIKETPHVDIKSKRKTSTYSVKETLIYKEAKLRRREWEKEMREKIKLERKLKHQE